MGLTNTHAATGAGESTAAVSEGTMLNQSWLLLLLLLLQLSCWNAIIRAAADPR